MRKKLEALTSEVKEIKKQETLVRFSIVSLKTILIVYPPNNHITLALCY